jgi:hypothetical protein
MKGLTRRFAKVADKFRRDYWQNPIGLPVLMA